MRKLCDTREKYFLTSAELKALSKIVDLDRTLTFLKNEKVIGPNDTWEEVPFYKAKKTEECSDGYSGRIGIHEVLKVSQTIRELILKGASQDDIEIQAKKEGMMTMIDDGIF